MSFSPGAANFMTSMTFDKCSRPFWVYAVTGSAAFLELFWWVGFLDVEDLVRAIGFSESASDLGRARRGRRHGGIRMPRGTPGSVKTYSALGVRTLLIATIPLEIIGFAWLLYNRTDAFFYRWSSLLTNIKCEGEPRTLMRTDKDFGAFPSMGGGAVALDTLLATTGIYSSTAFGCSVPFGAYEVSLALEIEGKTPVNGGDYQAGIFTTGALGASLRTGNKTFIKSGQGGTTIFNGTIVFPLFSGGTIGWVIVGPAVPVGVAIKEAHVVVNQAGG